MFKAVLLLLILVILITFFSMVPNIAEKELNDSINHNKGTVNGVLYNNSNNLTKQFVNGSKAVVLDTFNNSIKSAKKDVSNRINTTIDGLANNSKVSINRNLQLTNCYVLIKNK